MPPAPAAKPDLSRAAILQRLRAKVAQGLPIVGGGAGTGISAKCEEAGGIDLIVIYNSGRFRMAGRGSLAGMLPYGNANEIVREMAHEVLTAVRHTPVLAGVCGTDPFLLREPFLREIKQMGFSGIQNFPTVGLFEGAFRANLEETGMGYEMEVECVALARELDLLTSPYAFTVDEAQRMTRAGADIVVAHMGLTTSGTIGARTAKTLDQSVGEVQAITDACKAERADCLVLCHGGPIANPDDAQYILDRCRGVDGFYGASSMERLPTEIAITEQVKKFERLRLKNPG
ncbi:MAG: phosphoenolpyruvate hydrolase family protein [Planctomycetia bacterium]|nr:phosphoenolpyruvate hydrolase family protein [Planctomycetia bacterium]